MSNDRPKQYSERSDSNNANHRFNLSITNIQNNMKNLKDNLDYLKSNNQLNDETRQIEYSKCAAACIYLLYQAQIGQVSAFKEKSFASNISESDKKDISLFIDKILNTDGGRLMNYTSSGTSDLLISNIRDTGMIANELNKLGDTKAEEQNKLLESLGMPPENKNVQNEEKPLEIPPENKNIQNEEKPQVSLSEDNNILKFRGLKKEVFNALDELENRGGSKQRIKEIQAAKKNIREVVLTSAESKALRSNNPEDVKRVTDNIIKRFDEGLSNLDTMMSNQPNLFHRKGLSLAIGVRDKISKSELTQLASPETKKNLQEKVNLHKISLETKIPESKPGQKNKR